MAEGVATADGAVISSGIHDDPEREPAPDPEAAPKGWTWDKGERRWRPRRTPGRKRKDQGESRDEPRQPGEFAGRETIDPDPGWMLGHEGAGSFVVTDELRKDISATIALMYSIPADFLLTADPYCFGALNSNLTPVIGATTDLVCASPRIARWAASGAGLMLWVKLMAALRPFLVAVWHHHVLNDVVTVPDGSEGASGSVQDYSAYPAAPGPEPVFPSA